MSVKSPPSSSGSGVKNMMSSCSGRHGRGIQNEDMKTTHRQTFPKPCKKIPLLTCVPWNEKRGVKWRELKKRKRVAESKSTWTVTRVATFVCKHGNYAHWSCCKKVLLKEPLPFHADPILPPNKNDSWSGRIQVLKYKWRRRSLMRYKICQIKVEMLNSANFLRLVKLLPQNQKSTVWFNFER